MNGLPKIVLNRTGKMDGKVVGSSRCQLEGCSGLRLHVRWRDGKLTKPCSKGMQHIPGVNPPTWRIL